MDFIENLIPYLCGGFFFLVVGIISKYVKVQKTSEIACYRAIGSDLIAENWEKIYVYFPNVTIKAGISLIIVGLLLFNISSSTLIMTLNLLVSPLIAAFYIIFITEERANLD